MKTLSMTWASCAVALMLTVSGCYAGPDFITFLRHHIAHNDNQRVT